MEMTEEMTATAEAEEEDTQEVAQDPREMDTEEEAVEEKSTHALHPHAEKAQDNLQATDQESAAPEAGIEGTETSVS